MTVEWENTDSIRDSDKGDAKYASQLAEGESLEGEVLALVTSTQDEKKSNLLMRNADGEEFLLFTCGTLQSKTIKFQKIAVGDYIKITRRGDNTFTTKKGKSITEANFEVMRAKAQLAPAI